MKLELFARAPLLCGIVWLCVRVDREKAKSRKVEAEKRGISGKGKPFLLFCRLSRSLVGPPLLHRSRSYNFQSFLAFSHSQLEGGGSLCAVIPSHHLYINGYH